MKRIFRAVKLSLVLAILAACGGGGLDNQLSLYVINASPDAPFITFLIDGAPWLGYDYTGGGTGGDLTPGSRQMALQVVVPGDVVLIEDAPVSLVAGHQYVTIAVGKLGQEGNSTLQMLHIDNPAAVVPAEMTRVQFVHAAPDIASSIDVYVTAADDSLDAAQPSFSIGYIQQPTALQQDVSSGIRRIRVTPSGDKNTLLFDSGALVLRPAANLLFVVVTNTRAGTAPVSLLVNDGTYPAGILPPRELLNVATPADVRVINVSPDLPSLVATAERALRKDTLPPDPPLESPCIYDPTLPSDDVLCVAPPPEVTPLVAGLTYPAAASYVSLDFSIPPPAGYAFLYVPDFYTFKVAATDAPETTLFAASRSLVQGVRVSLLTVGLVPPADTIAELAALIDDIRPIARVGKLRIVNASLAAGTADVYIEAPGTDISTEAPLGSVPVITPGNAASYIPFAPGAYTVSFTATGTKTVLASANVAAVSESVFTIVLVDTARAISSDGTPPEVMVIDDLL